MSTKFENYSIRIDNSICDVVALKTPSRVFMFDKKTPVSQAFYDKVFPMRYGVMYSHINPNDDTDRIVYVYFDVEKDSHLIGDHEVEITNLKMSPKVLHDQCKNHNYRRHIFVTYLDNLIPVYSNFVKRDKIIFDGKTFAMVNDLSTMPLSPSVKEKLKDYDLTSKEEGYQATPEAIGSVIKCHYKDLYPVEVKFPNGFVGRFRIDQLKLFHDIDS